MAVLGCGLFFGNLVVVLVVLSHELYQEGEPDSLCRGVRFWLVSAFGSPNASARNSQNSIAKAISVEIVNCI